MFRALSELRFFHVLLSSILLSFSVLFPAHLSFASALEANISPFYQPPAVEVVLPTSTPLVVDTRVFEKPQDVRCLCVRFLRTMLGVNIRGDADTIKSNIKMSEAGVGDVILMRYPKSDHVVKIIGVGPDYWITHSSNYPVPCEERVFNVPFNSKNIRGFYRGA